MENTDFVIEHIDEEVQVIADQPSVVTNYSANTDFFIENIDSNVISIAHSLNIEASEVNFRPANTDFFIENIDKNVIAITESMSLSPSEVDFRPANTDFFVENIDKNLIKIAESLSLTPYEVTICPANTDMFIENIDKNVTLIKGSTNVVTVSGEYININLPDGGKVQSAQLNGNATQDGTPTPDAPLPISVVTGENVVKVVGKNLLDETAMFSTLSSSLTISDATFSGSACKKIERTSATTVIYPLNVNGQATLQFDLATESSSNYYIFLAYSDGTHSPSVTGDKTSWSNITIVSDSTKTVTGIGFQLYTWSNVLYMKNLQLELGSQATTYEPYTAQDYTINLGTLELAKIGTYQDRIYKDGEKWYVKKRVGKTTLDGSEEYIWNYNSGTYSGFYRAADSVLTDGIAKVDDARLSKSNNFTCESTTTTWTGAGKFGFSSTWTMWFELMDNTITTYRGFNTWLSTHPTTIYYPLATPTTTEITDQTLIDQLEALAGASLNQGVNNIWIEIATGNAMPTLELVIEKY